MSDQPDSVPGDPTDQSEVVSGVLPLDPTFDVLNELSAREARAHGDAVQECARGIGLDYRPPVTSAGASVGAGPFGPFGLTDGEHAASYGYTPPPGSVEGDGEPTAALAPEQSAALSRALDGDPRRARRSSTTTATRSAL